MSDPVVSPVECESYNPSGFSMAAATTEKPKACYLNKAGSVRWNKYTGAASSAAACDSTFSLACVCAYRAWACVCQPPPPPPPRPPHPPSPPPLPPPPLPPPRTTTTTSTTTVFGKKTCQPKHWHRGVCDCRRCPSKRDEQRHRNHKWQFNARLQLDGHVRVWSWKIDHTGRSVQYACSCPSELWVHDHSRH